MATNKVEPTAFSPQVNRQRLSDSPTGIENFSNCLQQSKQQSTHSSLANFQPSTPQGEGTQRLSDAFRKDNSAGAPSPFSGEKRQSVRRNSLTGNMDSCVRDRENHCNRRLMATDLMGDQGGNATIMFLMRQRVENELKERQSSAKRDNTSLLEAVKKIHMAQSMSEPTPESAEAEETTEEGKHPQPALEKNASDRRFAASMQMKLREMLPALNRSSSLLDTSIYSKPDHDNDDDDEEYCSLIFSPIEKDVMKKLTNTHTTTAASGKGTGDLSSLMRELPKKSMSRHEDDDNDEEGDDIWCESGVTRRSSHNQKEGLEQATRAKYSRSLSNFHYQHDADVNEEEEEEEKAETEEPTIIANDIDVDIDEDDVSSGDDDENDEEDEDENDNKIRPVKEKEKGLHVEPKLVGTPTKKPKGILKRTSTFGAVTPTSTQTKSMSQSMHEVNSTRNLLHSLYDGGVSASARCMPMEPSTPQGSKPELIPPSPSSTPTGRRSRTSKDLNRTPSGHRLMGDKPMGDRSQSTTSRRLKRGEESSRGHAEKKNSKGEDMCSTPRGEEKSKLKSSGSPRSRLRTCSKLSEVSPRPYRGRASKDTEEKKSRTRSRSRNRDAKLKRGSSRPRTQRRSNRPSETEKSSKPMHAMSDHGELSRGPRRSRQKGSLRKAHSDRHGMNSSSRTHSKRREDDIDNAAEDGYENNGAPQFDLKDKMNVSIPLGQPSGKLLGEMLDQKEDDVAEDPLHSVDDGHEVKEKKQKKSKSRPSIMKLPWIGKKSNKD